MSDDIVDRLRERADRATESPMMSAVRDTLEWEAADEIVFLRDDIKQLMNSDKKHDDPAMKLVVHWMMNRGYATGHGDSLTDLLNELDWQAQERGRLMMAKELTGGKISNPDQRRKDAIRRAKNL